MRVFGAFGRIAFVAAVVFACAGCVADLKQTDTWVEVRSPHFTVVSNSGVGPARRTAEEFEQLRRVFQVALPRVRVDTGRPVIILAVRDQGDLKALLPGFWEQRGRSHPAGIFVPGPGRHYVALCLDVPGENPYSVIYHEYVHLLVRLNFNRVPLWLNEGLAELYGNTTITGRQAGLGRPIAQHLANLRRGKRISLEKLLTADQSSPFYNEANKATLFYAQSWALAHYLTLGDKSAHQPLLVEYLRLLDEGVGDLDAARRAFGDFGALAKELDAYVRQEGFYFLPIPKELGVSGRDFSARVLPPAEAAARRGDFHIQLRRFAEARELLEEALRLEPDLPAAHESTGLLYLQEGDQAKAIESFERAVELGSDSFLAHYYAAALALKPQMTLELRTRTEQRLHRAVELNPKYPPSYSALAALYAVKAGGLEEALGTARKAVDLEPGATEHRLNVANILVRMGRVGEAREMAERALVIADTPERREMARRFLEHLRSTYPEQAGE